MKCLALGLLVFIFSFGAQANAVVNITPNQANYQVGDTILLFVTLSESPKIFGGGLNIRFNPDVLQAQSVVINHIWSLANRSGVINNTEGRIDEILFASFDTVEGELDVAIIQLEVIANGDTDFSVTKSLKNPLSDANGQVVSFIINNLFAYNVQLAEQSVDKKPEHLSAQMTEQTTIHNTNDNAVVSANIAGKNQGADSSQNDRQFFLPSGSGAIPITVTDDNTQGSGKVQQSAKTIKDKTTESITNKWGVDNFRVRQSSAGYMLNISYRVVDSEKAKPLFDRKLRPFIIEEASDVRYGVPASPKVGFLRQAPGYIKENKDYFLMIANPGKRIKTGDRLTLVIGDFRVEHLTVE